MKKLLITIAFGVLATAVFAQEYKTEYVENTGTYERISERGPYLTNKFFDNWFIGVAGGVNMYMSDGDDEADFGDRLAPAIDAYIGKWITPSVGFRLMYSGLSAKGASPASDYFTKGEPISTKDGVNFYEKEFDFWSAQFHFMWNLSNAIGGYRADRTWSFIPYGGAGYMEATKNDAKIRDGVGYAGLLNNIRLSKSINITLDARFAFMKPGMDLYNNDKDMDNMLTVTAGLSYNFGRRAFKRPAEVALPDYTPYQERINTLEGQLSNANDNINRLAKELEECKKRPAPAPVVECAPVAPMHVYFKIGSSRIAETDMQNIESIANTIKATPGKKYSVVGAADAATGSATRNKQLSNQRAKAVADALTGKFGVKADQLDVDSKGGINSGGKPELDRVVIVEQK